MPLRMTWGIGFRSFYIGVPGKLLQNTNIHTMLKHMSSKRVTQGMARLSILDFATAVFVDGTGVSRKDILPQFIRDHFRKIGGAVFSVLNGQERLCYQEV